MAITVEQFRDQIHKSRVACALCGIEYHSLVQHLLDSHKMSPGQYRKEFPTSKLASPVVSELIRRLDRRSVPTDSLEPHLEMFAAKGSSSNDILKTVGSKLPPVDPKFNYLIPVQDPFFEFEDDLRVYLYALAACKNTYIEGPTGCGKTEVLLQIHAAMGRPVFRVNMRGDVTAATFIGEKDADPTKGTYFTLGVLPLAMQAGIPLIVDEVDFTPPHIAATLHPALEGNRKIFIPEANQYFQAAPGFTVLATANTGGKGDSVGNYTGTEVLNAAFLNRFSLKVKKDYLPIPKEIAMLEARFPTVTKSTITNLVKACAEVRVSFKQGSLSVCYSTRTLIEYFNALPALGSELAMRSIFSSWLDDDDFVLVANLFDRCSVKLVR